MLRSEESGKLESTSLLNSRTYSLLAGNLMITQEYIKSILHYCPITGIFTWLYRNNGKKWWNAQFSGKISGHINKRGYVKIGIGYKTYMAHRLAWLYVYGTFPLNEIDHINGIKNDNSILNLRDVTSQGNKQNLRKPPSHNKSGYIGVSFCKAKNKWRALIKINKKQKYIGIYSTALEAHENYLIEKRKYHATCSI